MTYWVARCGFAMQKKADFYLSAAGEVGGDLAIPRACWIRTRLRDDVRDDHMLIHVEPPVIGQAFGLGGQNIVDLIISTRHSGFSLFPITEWPSYVYIARILDETVAKTFVFRKDQVEVIAWGMVFRTRDEAKSQVTNACRCDFVERLEGNEGEEYARSHLVEIKRDQVNWKALYRCPTTGKYWKERFPFAEAHGGGPPEFLQILAAEALREFDLTEKDLRLSGRWVVSEM